MSWLRDHLFRSLGISSCYQRVFVLSLLGAIAFALPASVSASDGTERFVPLEGVHNTRDLGGLTTEDGRKVRTGQILRSGEIDHISDASMAQLNDMDVTSVIDLRTRKEATSNPALWPEGTGPARHNFPLMEKESDLIDDMRSRIKSGTAEAEWMDNTFYEVFGYVPTEYTDEIRQVFDVLIAAPDGEAVMFHCSGGKDRTGVVSALVLSALGVSSDEIRADFLLSNVANDADAASVKLASEISKATGNQISAADVWPSLGVRDAYLDLFYETLDAEYGGVQAYLHDGLGLTEQDLRNLRSRYLE